VSEVKLRKPKKTSPARRYLPALLGPVIVAGVMQLTWPFFQQSPVSLFLLAVTFSAWYGGLGPGLSTVLVSFLLVVFFVAPDFNPRPPAYGELVDLVVLATVGPLISVLSELMQRQKRRAEINLNISRTSEERYRKLAENFPSGAVATYDRDLRVTFIGGKGLKEPGRPPDFYVGKVLDEIAPPELVAIAKPQFLAAFEGQTTAYECAYPDGRSYSVDVAPLLNGSGLVNEILVISQEITERKRAENDLRKQKEILQTIFDHIPLMMSFYDEHGVKMINREWERARGWSQEDLRSGRVDVLAEAYPDPHDLQRARDFIAAGAGEWAEFKMRMRDGRLVDTSWASVRLSDGMRINIGKDITKRKLAEERLREYEKVVEVVDDKIVVVDRNYCFLIVNRAFLYHRNLNRDQVIGHHVSEFLDPAVFERIVKPKLDECFQGKVVTFELRYAYPELGERDLFLSYFPIEGPEGVDRAACIMRDITEQKRAEEALRQSERHLAEAQRLAHVGSWNWDRRANIVTWSDELYRIFGMPPQELHPGGLAMELIHPEDRDLLQSTIEASLKSKEPYDIYYRVIRPDGVERIVNTHGLVMCDEHGETIRVFGASQDVTERKQAEKALREAEQKYRDIFENAGEGIFQTTPEGQFLAANPALARMHGFDSPEEMTSSLKDISRQVYADPTRRQEFKDLMEAEGSVKGFEHQILRRDGCKIWVSINARAVRDKHGEIRYYEGTTQDINERKLAEARSAAFATLARKLSGASTQIETGRIIAETAQELFGWDSCNLDLYDADNDVVHPMLNIDTIEGRRVDITAFCVDRKPTARGRLVIDHGPQLVLREEPIQFDEDAVPFGDTFRPSASIMIAPIRHASKVVGLLSIQSYTPRAYDVVALNDLQFLADHCGEVLNRIHAEQSFFESEERFRQLAEHFEDVVWLTDREIRRVLYINPAYERIFRRTCESICERLDSFLDTIHPEDRPSVELRLDRERNGHHEPGEFRIIWPDGSIRWVLRRSFPIRNTEGQVYLVAGISQDITNRKRVQDALRESEERYRDLVENSRELICTHDLNGLILSANPAAAENLGYKLDDLVGKMSIRDILAPEGRHQFDEYMARVLRDGATGGIMIVERSSGEQRLWEFYNSVRREGVSTPVVRGMARDITEGKRAEAALRQSEERYRELFENAKDAIYVHDLSGRYVSLNLAAEKLSGYASDEIIGKHFSNFVAPRDLKYVRTNLCKKLDEEGETTYEVDVITKDRRRVPVEVISRLIYENGQPIGVQGTARDITERKRAQEALQVYSRRLIEAQEAERQSLARELHDEIGQVLTAVRINLQTVQSSSQNVAALPHVEESIVIVDEALGRIRDLSLELRPSLLDDLGLASALRWYVDRYGQRTGIAAEVLCGFEERGRLPLELETECFRIAQEALTNVARHAHATHLSVQLDSGVEKLLLTITDNGIGFDAETLLNTASSASTLGLRGMQERALAMNGHIEINSSPGNGTQVRATFPLKRSNSTR